MRETAKEDETNMKGTKRRGTGLIKQMSKEDTMTWGVVRGECRFAYDNSCIINIWVPNAIDI